MNKQRNTKGQFHSKGMNDIYRHLIIASILIVGMFALFGIRADAKRDEWKANAQINATSSQNTPMSLSLVKDSEGIRY